MEDELDLDQEGLEEEISPPKKKSKGSPLKKIIVFGGMLIIALLAVFGFILPTWFGESPVQGEADQEEIIDTRELTEYGTEFSFPSITVSIKDDQGRVRNLIVDVVFETSDKGIEELDKRTGQIRNIIQTVVKSYDFNVILNKAIQDSIALRIQKKLNIRLPLAQKDKIKTAHVFIITQ